MKNILVCVFFVMFCSSFPWESVADEYAAKFGLFDATADWGLPLFPPQQGIYKVPGKVSVSHLRDGFIYDIFGNGDDIGNISDEGFFVYGDRAGSWKLSAKVHWIEGGGPQGRSLGKVGLQIRERGPDPGSKFYFFALKSGWGKYIGMESSIIFRLDDNTIAESTQNIKDLHGEDLHDPGSGIFFKVTRIAPLNLIRAECSYDGITWRMVHECYFLMHETVAYGIAITNRADSEELGHARISNLNLEPVELSAYRILSQERYLPGEQVKVILEFLNPYVKTKTIQLVEMLPRNWRATNISYSNEDYIQVGLNSTPINESEKQRIYRTLHLKPGLSYMTYLANAMESNIQEAVFSGRINEAKTEGKSKLVLSPFSFSENRRRTFLQTLYTAIPMVMAVVHFILFLFYPRMKENLHFAIFSCGVALFGFTLFQWELLATRFFFLRYLSQFLLAVLTLRFFYSLSYDKIPLRFWYIISLPLLVVWISIWLPLYPLDMMVFNIYILYVFVEIIRILIHPIRLAEKEGIWIPALGALIFCLILVYTAFAQIMGWPDYYEHGPWPLLLIFLFMSVYLAYQFAKTNKDLAILNLELEMRIEERTVQLKEAQNQIILSEKMASLGQLVAGVAHEINNPINFIRSNLQPLKEYLSGYKKAFDAMKQMKERFPHDIKSAFEEIAENEDLDFACEDSDKLIQSFEDGSNRIAQIVAGLRQYSRVDEEYYSPYDLREAIDSTLDLLFNRYKDKIRIQKNYDDIPQVNCSPGKINQAFMNLLSNAIEAIEGEGNIWIHTTRQDENVLVKIRDDGKGIAKEIQSKIFDPFFTTKPVGEGTGLGLSITYSIIEQHGGTIIIESEVGKGTTFTVILPIKKDIE